jgi:Holliday junction resolvase
MMGASERRKGKKAELDVAGYMREHGWEAATTRGTSGAQEGDDIVTNAPVSIEVKNHVRLDLSSWVHQALQNAQGQPAIVWHKKRGESSPGNWYVTMTGQDFMRILGKPDDV